MAKANFKAKSFTAAKMSGSLQEHNERNFSEHHKKPGYILPDEFHLKNESFTKLSTEDVTREYIETTEWGKKHGKLHHKAEPFREAIVHFESHHTIEDMKRLSTRLEDELSIQVMYCYMHKDEGHIDEFGKPQYNFHAHLGFTNLKGGKLRHFDNVKCAKAQDICAEVLGMERGARNSSAIGLDHRSYRRMMREKDILKKEMNLEIQSVSNNGYDHWRESERLTQKNEDLHTEVHYLSKRIRTLLKENSRLAEELGIAKTKASDYQEVKNSKLALDVKALQNQLAEANRRNEELQASLKVNDLANHNENDDRLIESESATFEKMFKRTQMNSSREIPLLSKLLSKLKFDRAPIGFEELASRALEYIETLETKLETMQTSFKNQKGLMSRSKR